MVTNREKYIDKLSDKELGVLLRHKCYIGLNGKIKTEPIEEVPEGDSIEIHKWLSQEAEEKRTCKNCKSHKKVKPCIGAIDKKCVNPKSKDCGSYTMDDCSCDEWESMKKCGIDEVHTQVVNLPNETKIIQLTEKAYKDILARLDKLEEEGKTKDPKDFAINGCSPIKKEKTADEMFEELGYEKIREDNCIVEYSKTEEVVEGKRCEGIMKPVIQIYHQLKDNMMYSKYEIRECEDGELYLTYRITETEDKAIHKKIEEIRNGNSNN